jgi:hypothetical protein
MTKKSTKPRTSLRVKTAVKAGHEGATLAPNLHLNQPPRHATWR